MKEKVMVILMLSLFSFFLLRGRGSERNDSGWKYIKNRKEVAVLTRWSAERNNTRFKEIKAEASIHAPMDRLLDMIQSGIYSNEWMAMVGNYYTTEGQGENQWDSKVTYKLPWPLSKNNLLVGYNLLHENSDSAIISFKSKHASLFNKGINPTIYQFNGCWEFTSADEGATKVSLTINWDKNNVLPSWFSSPLIADGIGYSLRNLKNLSEEKYKIPFGEMAVIAL